MLADGRGPARTMSGPGGELAGMLVVGYASVPPSLRAVDVEISRQAEQIDAECERRSMRLVEVVGERDRTGVKALSRPGLAYALDRIARGEAAGLVVADLSRLAHSAAELGGVLRRLSGGRTRLVAAAQELDTGNEHGRLAATLLVEISGWERKLLSERTRNGLNAARNSGRITGRAAVADHPDLLASISGMRADGMTLQAIADRLNADGVPTIRGGAKWRHSSVQVALGYRRGGRPVA